MMRSLFSGVTGLRSHQTRMDVIGNNIANVNTVGFKKSTVTFKDLYSETISAAAASTGTGTGAGTTGGVNPKQIGLGAAVNSISQVHTAGSAQYTGNGMDVSISGDGYFVVKTPTGNMYTRAGNFFTDVEGNLVTSDGYYVQTVLPVQAAEMQYSLNSVKDGTLTNTSGIVYPSGNVIHSGNITADLADALDKTYTFSFKPDDTAPWEAEMTSASEYLPASSGTITITGTPLSQAQVNQMITEAVEAAAASTDPAVAATAKEGTVSLSIKFNDAARRYELCAGDLVLGYSALDDSAAAGFPSTGLVDGGTKGCTMTFVDAADGTTPLTSFQVAYNGDGEFLLADMTNFFNRTTQPSVTIKQNGEWQMKDDAGSIVDTVHLSATTAAGGGMQGDFMISTTEFGNFTLAIQGGQVAANNTALSNMLSTSFFQLDITAEWGVGYSAPGSGGEVAEGSMQSLTIDFDKYSSLAIDPTGAVVAQLKQPQQVLVDGQTVNMLEGQKVVLGYIVLANFNNPIGLEKVGDNLFAESANSGAPSYGIPGTGSCGSLTPSNLEMSNVDLSEEIVNMIITQRGFQANSRIITTTDTMLEELVNLKR